MLKKSTRKTEEILTHLYAGQRKHTSLMTVSWIIMPCHSRGMSFWGCKSCCRHKSPEGRNTTCCSLSPGQMYETNIKPKGRPTCCLTITPGGSLKKPQKGVGRWGEEIKSHVKVIGRRWTPGKHGAHSSPIYTAYFQNQTYIPQHKYSHVCMQNMQVYNKAATNWRQLSPSSRWPSVEVSQDVRF